MVTYLGVGIGSGLLFAVLDGAANANPLARRLYSVYGTLAKERVNVPVGFAIDIAYGLAMAALFKTLHGCLPGDIGALKGLCFAGIAWFFRVVMGVVSEWMTRKVTPLALLYTLGAGFIEMVILGVLYGLTLGPWG